MKLFMVINEDNFFLSHRLPLAQAALAEGYDVTLIAQDTGRKQECLDACLVHKGTFRYLDIPMNPTGMNLKQEMKTLIWLLRLFMTEHPDVVHLVGMKCMLWGGIAARISRIPIVINAVSGLGIMFSAPKLGMVAKIMLTIQRWSNHRKGVFLIFQNQDDKALYMRHKVMKEEQCRFIKGSGVDLSVFDYTPELEPETAKVYVVFMARMVKDKGVCDLVNAAKLMHNDYHDKVEFWLCGGISANPRALKEEELKAMCDGEYIQWFGFRSDVRELLKKCHIVAYPSYYREGVPKSLIEASAIGRPIITCNSVGCKDVVEDGVNGFLIEPHNIQQLEIRLKQLIEDKVLREQMGRKSREIAVRYFSIEKVIEAHMELYRKGIGDFKV